MFHPARNIELSFVLLHLLAMAKISIPPHMGKEVTPYFPQ